MEMRIERPAQDVWAERWRDSALQRLGRWLTDHGISDTRAVRVVDGVWVFYSYHMLPALHRRVPIGIAANVVSVTHVDSVVYVWLYYPASAHGPIRSEIDLFLQKEFDRVTGLSLAQDSAALGQGVTIRLNSLGVTPEEFDSSMRRFSTTEKWDYVGIFVDDLRNELTTIMRPEAMPAWLEAPNTLFAGRTPTTLLVDPDPDMDRPLRDLLLSARYGVFS